MESPLNKVPYTYFPTNNIKTAYVKQLKNHGKFQCHLCGSWSPGFLAPHLRLCHGITPTEYESQTGQSALSDEKKEFFANKVKGSNNPGYQHGGKLSPYSTNFVGYEGRDKEELQKELCEKARVRTEKSITEGNCVVTLDYWLKRGMSEDEARDALRERQSTFNLDKCIAEHGEEEGRRRWQKRQDKWQNTLNSKPQEEIDEINRRKATALNWESMRRWIRNTDGIEEAMQIPASVYILQLDQWLKIGFTSVSAESRTKGYTNMKVDILHVEEGNAPWCFMLEQILHRKFWHNKIRGQSFVGHTETYENITLNDVVNVIEMYRHKTIDELREEVKCLSKK